MFLNIERWRPRHLLLAWVTYWAIMACVALGPPVLAAWQLRGPDRHGTVNAAFSSKSGIDITIAEAGSTSYSGHVGSLALILWVAGPPLLLWLLWLARRPRGAIDPELVDARAPELSELPGTGGTPALPGEQISEPDFSTEYASHQSLDREPRERK